MVQRTNRVRLEEKQDEDLRKSTVTVTEGEKWQQRKPWRNEWLWS